MALSDRDYMRERQSRTPLTALRSWWRRSTITQILSVGLLAIAFLSSAVWFFRDLGFSAPSGEATLRVNVNSATLDELETLPGIGPALARLIVAGRPYEDVEALARVRGIGQATVESLRPFVKVSGETETIHD
jgi:competence ComEA-like helix-hairpin-helix protein